MSPVVHRWTIGLCLLLLMPLFVPIEGTATAAVPLPSLRQVLTDQEWQEVSRLMDNHCQFDAFSQAFSCEEGVSVTVRERIDEWQSAFGEDPSLGYLRGLSYRYDGEPAKAADHFERVVKQDPTYVAAWYDLGEIRLAQGDMTQAALAFAEVSQRKSGHQGWLGPWREAEVAAHQRKPDVFEDRIKQALRRGFSFRQIQGLPNWRAFVADPVMADVVTKMVTVYGSDEILNSLTEPAQ